MWLVYSVVHSCILWYDDSSGYPEGATIGSLAPIWPTSAFNEVVRMLQCIFSQSYLCDDYDLYQAHSITWYLSMHAKLLVLCKITMM